MDLKNKLVWYNHILNKGKEIFKEIWRWFARNYVDNVDESDIMVGIGYIMRKKCSEEYKIEDVIEHLDEVFGIY